MKRFITFGCAWLALACAAKDKSCEGQDVKSVVLDCDVWVGEDGLEYVPENIIECVYADPDITTECADCINEHTYSDSAGYHVELSACGLDHADISLLPGSSGLTSE